jgi:hypothetical protein
MKLVHHPKSIHFWNFRYFRKFVFVDVNHRTELFATDMAWPIAMDLAMQVPRWAGHDKEIRRPQRIAVGERCSKDWVRRLVGRVQTCRVTRSCEEPVRPHQPCHGHATRNVASYGHASTGVVRWAYYIPRASVSPCRRWHLEMFVTEVSSEVTVANENTTRVAKAWSKSMDPIGPVEVNPWMANLDALGVGRNPSDSHRFWLDFGQKWAI